MENNLEEKFKKLKPENVQVNVTEKVMQHISEKKMRSAWYFRSKRAVIISSFVLAFLVMVFLVNLTIYDILEGYSLEYANFGTTGIAIILQNLPYLLISMIIGLFIFSVWMMSKFEISYQKSFSILIIILVVGVSMGGSAIFASDFNETVQDKVDNKQMKTPVVKPVAVKIYKRYGPRMLKQNTLVGRIEKVPAPEANEFVIITPQGKKIQVRLMKNYKMVPSDRKLASGDLIFMIGKPVVNFHANGIKIIENKEKARQMYQKLQPKPFIMKFRSRMPLNDFQDFPHDMEKRKEFMENMGGVLQSGQDIRQANIMLE